MCFGEDMQDMVHLEMKYVWVGMGNIDIYVLYISFIQATLFTHSLIQWWSLGFVTLFSHRSLIPYLSYLYSHRWHFLPSVVMGHLFVHLYSFSMHL